MKEDTGQILIVDKIVNNNIVIAKDFRGREVVAIGKGVGFRKRKNEAVHRSEIMKTYVLLDKVDSGVLTLFEEIQFEVIETSQKIIDYAQEKLNVKFNVNLLMSLSDHINFALIQYRQGNHVPKLVNEEVKRFYKEEYQVWSQRILHTSLLKYLAGEEKAAENLYSLYNDKELKREFFKNIIRKSIYEYYFARQNKEKIQAIENMWVK